MPDIENPTLLVVCDSHKCRFMNAGGRLIMEKETVESKEEKFSDSQGRLQAPAAMGKGGMVSGVGDLNPAEKNRLRNFANMVSKRLTKIISEQGIKEVYISAPPKFLSILREHIPSATRKIIAAVEGIFIKEPALKLLIRFKPELKDAANSLRDQENYSARKHLPKG
ncbi:hypothetical protein A3C52_03125 [Candidatus Peribacteria bacterium RIFCSPHIGHO2_02_FULL_51_15]|nr:MAG: hypothetical protein A3C52_03125 [Candidatus Peribacteria bacterium RIFCSPHIGHO2_02_FULL_51_15]